MPAHQAGAGSNACTSPAPATRWDRRELVHIEVLFFTTLLTTRAPTHELTIARDVLKTRRRIAAQPRGWALSADGLRSLRGQDTPTSVFEPSHREIGVMATTGEEPTDNAAGEAEREGKDEGEQNTAQKNPSKHASS